MAFAFHFISSAENVFLLEAINRATKTNHHQQPLLRRFIIFRLHNNGAGLILTLWIYWIAVLLSAIMYMSDVVWCGVICDRFDSSDRQTRRSNGWWSRISGTTSNGDRVHVDVALFSRRRFYKITQVRGRINQMDIHLNIYINKM